MTSLTLLLTLALARSAWGADWRIGVGISQDTGNPGQGFDPNRIVAVAGDTVTFEFSRATAVHSVVQGTFDAPCSPMPGGFSVPAQGQGSSEFVFNVTNTSPTFFYSGAANDCQAGMVFGINTDQSSAQSIDAYQNASRQTKQTVQVSSAASSAASTAPSSTTSASVMPSQTGAASSSSLYASWWLVLGGAGWFSL